MKEAEEKNKVANRRNQVKFIKVSNETLSLDAMLPTGRVTLLYFTRNHMLGLYRVVRSEWLA